MELVNAPVRVLAIDPGKSGAACVLGKGKFQVLRDFKELPDIAKAIKALSDGVTHPLMEFVHAMPGQGVVSMFSFGRAAGVADGAFAVCLPEAAVEEVTPQKWQNHFRALLNIPKDEEFQAREVCQKVFPASAPFLKRVKDHNTADAILMAIWRLSTL